MYGVNALYLPYTMYHSHIRYATLAVARRRQHCNNAIINNQRYQGCGKAISARILEQPQHYTYNTISYYVQHHNNPHCIYYANAAQMYCTATGASLCQICDKTLTGCATSMQIRLSTKNACQYSTGLFSTAPFQAQSDIDSL